MKQKRLYACLNQLLFQKLDYGLRSDLQSHLELENVDIQFFRVSL